LSAIPAPAHVRSTPVPAGKAKVALPPRVEIIALTGDDTLLEQIGLALDGESTIRHVESVDAAREFIRPLQPCVVLLDARGHRDLSATVESLQSPDGTCIVIVLAPADESASVSSAIRGSATFAILPIPVQTGQTMAILEGASGEALARHTLAAHSVASSPAPTVAAPATAAPASSALAEVWRSGDVPQTAPAKAATARSTGGSKRRAWAGVLAGIALVAVTLAWFTLRSRNPDERATAAMAPASQVAKPHTPPSMTGAPVPAGSSDELLDKARIALAARHYTEPEGDNALAYFRAVLAQDPANDEAKEGLQRIGALLDERLQSELGQRRFNDAAGTVAQLKLIRQGDQGLTQIDARLAEAQIAAALEAGNVDRANQLLQQGSQLGTLPAPIAAHWRDEIGRRQGDARTQVLAQLVTTRIRDGLLVDPPNDSAKAYLAQLRRAPSDPRGLADSATAELQQAYLLKIHDAAAQSRRDDLDRWLAEARELGVSPTRLAVAMRVAPPVAVQPANSQSEQLAQLVQDRIRDGRLLEPSQDSAVAYLNALRNEDPSGSATAASSRALSDALLEGGRKALNDRNLDAAQAHTTAARRLGLDIADVDTLERAIAAARATPAPNKAPALEIQRTRYVPPEYPQEALRKGIRGDVRVRITVAGDGKVKLATVVSSSPAAVFDQAALDAVRRWRFKPLAANDPGIEATVMTEIVFRPGEVTKP
jgi:TonB family protein